MTKRKVATAILAGAATVLMLSACSGGAQTGAEGTWGSDGDGEPQLVLAADGNLSGTDGCNRLMGSWEQTSDGTVDFGQVALTMMFCEGVDTWLSNLRTGVVDGGTLRILDEAGDEIGTLQRG